MHWDCTGKLWHMATLERAGSQWALNARLIFELHTQNPRILGLKGNVNALQSGHPTIPAFSTFPRTVNKPLFLFKYLCDKELIALEQLC